MCVWILSIYPGKWQRQWRMWLQSRIPIRSSPSWTKKRCHRNSVSWKSSYNSRMRRWILNYRIMHKYYCLMCPILLTLILFIVSGESTFDSIRNVLQWQIPLIDSNSPTGTMEFSAIGRPDDFYPVAVNFSSNTLYSKITIGGVQHVETKQPIKFSIEHSFVADQNKYQIS